MTKANEYKQKRIKLLSDCFDEFLKHEGAVRVSRKRENILSRYAFMAKACKRGDYTLKDIGEAVGKDHSTIIHARDCHLQNYGARTNPDSYVSYRCSYKNAMRFLSSFIKDAVIDGAEASDNLNVKIKILESNLKIVSRMSDESKYLYKEKAAELSLLKKDIQENYVKKDSLFSKAEYAKMNKEGFEAVCSRVRRGGVKTLKIKNGTRNITLIIKEQNIAKTT